jgi:phage tail tape-measure protein
MFRTRILSALLLCLPAATACAVDEGAVIGGAVGGGVGAAVGSEIGGRDGAIVGGAIGGAVGAGIGAEDEEAAGDRARSSSHSGDVIYVRTRPERPVPPGHGGVPPGQAMQGKHHPHGKW